MFQNLRDFISIPGVWAEEKKRTAHQKLQERSKLKYDTVWPNLYLHMGNENGYIKAVIT